MKKFAVVFTGLAIASSCLLTACGGTTTTETAPAPEASPAATTAPAPAASPSPAATTAPAPAASPSPAASPQ